MIHSLPARWIALLVFSLSLPACSSHQNPPAPDPAALLQSVPPADPAQYQRIVDMRSWRNPYLVLRTDGVGLLDPADNAEILLKPENLLARLARLPAAAWPYGRVVAVAEGERQDSAQDGIAIRRNRGIVGGILEGAHIAVDWVPSK